MCSAASSITAVDKSVLGEDSCSDFFLQCSSSLLSDELIQRSPRGKRVQDVLAFLQSLPKESIKTLAERLIEKLCWCLTVKKKLPSAVEAAIWTNFHHVRQSGCLCEHWDGVVTRAVPQKMEDDSHLCLQLLLDVLMKELISRKARPSAACLATPTINHHEENAVRYMAGYVAVKLTRRYSRKTRNNELKLKWQLFVDVLNKLKAQNQPGNPDSLFEYTKEWSELIDRGGLYHIDDRAYQLFKEIELLTRKFLNSRSISAFKAGENLTDTILSGIFESYKVFIFWEEISSSIPLKFEKYSVELLYEVCKLWVTIRGHAFAREWTSKFEQKYTKSLRKDLARKSGQD